MSFSSVEVVDSHTAGEPTRVVVAGGPELGNDALPERLRRFAAEHDDFRSTVVNEPRGSDVVVGALLCEPVDRSCAAGVIFFNNVGYLGMCGHGTIGLVVTLKHMGRIAGGTCRLDTVCGPVEPFGCNPAGSTLGSTPTRSCAALRPMHEASLLRL